MEASKVRTTMFDNVSYSRGVECMCVHGLPESLAPDALCLSASAQGGQRGIVTGLRTHLCSEAGFCSTELAAPTPDPSFFCCRRKRCCWQSIDCLTRWECWLSAGGGGLSVTGGPWAGYGPPPKDQGLPPPRANGRFHRIGFRRWSQGNGLIFGCNQPMTHIAQGSVT
jgi:hypothetical protein